MPPLLTGFLLRFAQGFGEAALTIVVGAVVAGVLRRMVGPAGARRLFGAGARGLIRGWLAGMLLPVCSLGVIPVARELRRAGVPGGTVLAFALAAPLLNPISFLYGLSLAEPIVILTYSAASLLLSTLAGFLWDRAFAGPEAAEIDAELARKADAEPAPAEGPRRVLAVFATAARELSGRDLRFYAAGLAGSALLSALIPSGALQHTMKHSDWKSPLLMAAVGVPLYTGPLTGMMKIGLMFEHGNSVGAAFVLFALGIGLSFGTLLWLLADFGPRRVVPWLAAYVGVVLVLAYGFEPLLYDARKSEADHTHAFDDYAAPFPASTGPAESLTAARGKLAERFGPLERQAAYGFLALAAAGLALRGLDRRGAVERWLTAAPPEGAAGVMRRKVPGPVLGAVALAGLVAFSVIGAFLYYPDRRRCWDEMSAVRAEAFTACSSGRADEAIRHLECWDLTARKLEVGEYLRALGVSAEQSSACEELRERLEEARDELLAGRTAEAKRLILGEVEKAYRACREQFPPPDRGADRE